MSRLGPVYCFGCGKPTGSVEYGDTPRGLIYGPCCADEAAARDAESDADQAPRVARDDYRRYRENGGRYDWAMWWERYSGDYEAQP